MFRLAVAAVLSLGLSACSSPPPAAPAGENDNEKDASLVAPAADAGGQPLSDAASAYLAPGYMPAGYTEIPIVDVAPVRKLEAAAQVLQPNLDYIAVVETTAGRMVLDLFEVDTPISVNSFVFLASQRFYDQVAFHRVIDGFMAQTGDPKSVSGAPDTWGTGGPGYEFGLEVKPELTYDSAGVLGMARSSSPTSNGSQFFITFDAQPDLDQKYTVWGRVLDGLPVLPLIVRGEPPTEPTRITRVGIGTKSR